MVWNLFPFKGDFSSGTSQKLQGTKSGPLWGQVLIHMGDLMFPQKLCMRHDAWGGSLSWWSCQSPVAHSYGLLNHPNNFYRWMFKFNEQFYWVIALLSHFECDSHTGHRLTQQRLLPPLTSTVSEVIIVLTRAFQSTILGLQVTWMSCTPFSLY